MTFILPSTTAVLVLTVVAAAVGVLTLAVSTTVFFVRNHGVRVARQESIPTYYRSLAFSH